MRNALAALAALAIATPASAAVVITSPLPGGTTIAMPATTYASQSGVGLQYFVPGVAWYSSISPFFGYSLLGTTLDQPLGDNGVWSGSPGYASLAAPMGSMYFSFLNPVAAVAAF